MNSHVAFSVQRCLEQAVTTDRKSLMLMVRQPSGPFPSSSLRSQVGSAFVLLLLASAHADAGEINFGRDIRPLLSDRCFKCHGPDRQNPDSDLHLDTHEGALSAIQPGNPETSELIARITTDDPDLKMPPVSSDRKPLTPDEIELLKRWIREGAVYADHWAYVPPATPAIPEVKQPDWANSEIDRFLLATMEEQRVFPAADADRRTLARRLYFDLTGLPPTPEELQAFVNDRRPEAYENLVDHLIASPHYGERMAMHWLDLVRYADTIGYHSDNERKVDLYRDYVIDAFNRNMPFDQFTIEQLAGDLLPDATVEQRIASGYNRLLQTTEEGGAQAKEYTAIYLADRVRNVSTVWMGSTMGCCQCHDHKFDPFTIRDFYAMGAFFADIKEIAVGRQQPNFDKPTPEQAGKLDDLNAQIAAINEAPINPQELTEWLDQQRKFLDATDEGFQITPPIDAVSNVKTALNQGESGVITVGGVDPDHDVYTVTLPTSDKPITAIRLETFARKNLPNRGLSRGDGNFILSEFQVEVVENGVSRPAKVINAAADFEQKGFPVSHAIDGNSATGWAVEGNRRPVNCTAVFVLAEPIQGGENVQLIVTLKHESQPRRNIASFRLSLSSSLNPIMNGFSDVPPQLATALRRPQDQLSKKDRALFEKSFRDLSPANKANRDRLENLNAEMQDLQKQIRKTFIVEMLEKPRDVRVLPRGNWQDDSGDLLQPAIPVRLGSLNVTDRRPTRLDLAQWLVDRQNPLTARVFVNRIWKLMFGEGISRSLEDVGYQGDWPTHPELLDWLAVDFMEHDWDIKRLVKQLVMTRAYQQSSQGPPSALQRDPFNKLLARQSRFRLNAEMIRDNALSVSGLLVPQIGGPSVKPYQPRGYWAHLNFPMREWETVHGPDQYRRGLYTFWCRSFLHPSLLAFDASTREECTADRPRSNTPLQALVLLNDPTYVEAARVLAQQSAAQSGTDEAKLQWIYQRVLQRDPFESESQILLPLLTSERETYRADPESAKALQQNGDAVADGSIDAVEIAAWTAVTRTLLNLHETITRD